MSAASVYSKIFVFIWCCLSGPRILQLHAGCLIIHFLKVIKLRTQTIIPAQFKANSKCSHVRCLLANILSTRGCVVKSITQLFNTISTKNLPQISGCWRLLNTVLRGLVACAQWAHALGTKKRTKHKSSHPVSRPFCCLQIYAHAMYNYKTKKSHGNCCDPFFCGNRY